MSIIEKLTQVDNISDIEQIIESTYPSWIVAIINDYSGDYPQLTSNWINLCYKLKTTPQKIILVKDINFEDKDDPKHIICDFLTKKGYCIRRAAEFVPCVKCQKAIPCIEIWNLLKERKSTIPREWENKCIGC